MSPHKHQGITLIELMITVAVLAILASIAIPSFSGYIRSDRIVKHSNELYAFLVHQRSQAIRTSGDVTICVAKVGPNDGGALACDPASTRFSDGALIFTDRGTTGQFDAATDQLVDYIPPAQGLVIYGVSEHFTMRFNGTLKNTSAYFVICDDDNRTRGGRILEINKIGRPSISELTANSCTT
ncbi:GspH/FimT family pseudopilin [Salinibius halmophilus]|uniref:GspH/FimT family pseudopilin n=1 Tax=Salinibius halmophilus TaxID=1853216 RepID=UPI0013148363|nr:GspH/FimT family pseudopilin [Salinibius halmophilus]